MSNNGLPTGIKKTDVQSELKRINAHLEGGINRLPNYGGYFTPQYWSFFEEVKHDGAP